MSIAWTTIEDALQAWATSATGLEAVWADAGPRPTGQYVSLHLGPIKQVGHDWIDVEDATSPVMGAEIAHKARGQRAVSLSLQCFAGPATGASEAARTLDGMIAASRLPTIQVALLAAGVGILGFGPVQSIGAIVGASTFEPRATLDVRLIIASEVTELGTYIQHVEVTDGITSVETTIP